MSEIDQFQNVSPTTLAEILGREQVMDSGRRHLDRRLLLLAGLCVEVTAEFAAVHTDTSLSVLIPRFGF